MTNLIQITAAKALFPGNLADELGILQAEIAQLKRMEAKLKAEIEAAADGPSLEGNFYRASVSYVDNSYTVDWEQAFKALVPKTRQDRAGEYTKMRKGGVRIAVKARSTKAA